MCSSIAKYLLFAFNFVFWLAGAAVLGVGIWLLVDPASSGVVEVSGIDIYYSGSYVLVAAGAVMLVVGFFGCCGAIKESQCLLGLYFVCLFIVFGLEVGIGIYAFVQYGSLEELVDDNVNGQIDDDLQEAWNNTQSSLKCCGTNTTCGSYGYNSLVPVGCGCDTAGVDNCAKASNVTGCMAAPGDMLIYSTPCNEAIYDFVEDNIIILGGIALGIGLAEILGMIISMCLCCEYKKQSELA